MLFQRSKIITRIMAGFMIMLIAIVLLGWESINSIKTIASTSDEIFEHPFTVSTSILSVRNDLLSNYVRVIKLLHTTDPGEKEKLVQGIALSKENADRNLNLIRTYYLGKKKDVDELEKAITEWRASRANTVGLILSGHSADAENRINTSDSVAADKALEKADNIYRFAENKALEFRQTSRDQSKDLTRIIIASIMLLIGASIVIASIITRSVTVSLKGAGSLARQLARSSSDKVEITQAIGAGDLDRTISISEPIELDESTLPSDELGNLLKAMAELGNMQISLDRSFQQMSESLRANRDAERNLNWLKSGQNKLEDRMRGELDADVLAEHVLSYLVGYLNAAVGAIYLYDDRDDILHLSASYALSESKGQYRLGEGVLGQAAREKQTITLTDIPPEYLKVSSVSGEHAPLFVSAVPLTVDDQLVGAIEFGAFHKFSAVESELLEQARKSISVALAVAIARQEKNRLLQQTIQQSEELRVQQEELQQSNEELEERAQMLEQQREQIRDKNLEITSASEELKRKADQLEQVSTYKSEFLANMSHELRTPLNSMMILSRLLRENRDGNLTAKQVEFAATINSAGNDLVNLINDILDLSKIEAGKLEYVFEDVSIPSICSSLEGMFRPAADQKGLGFNIIISPDVPQSIFTDEQRTLQILKNLLSNAVKFTSDGELTLRIYQPDSGNNPLHGSSLAFTVTDTGIGIPASRINQIFQAFVQADGSTSRRYGGTGLGLSISLQLAKGLGGELDVISEEGSGSAFSLYLPIGPEDSVADGCQNRLAVRSSPITFASNGPGKSLIDQPPVNDDRGKLNPNDQSILIIEDDLTLASILMELVRERGNNVLVATDGESGLVLADSYRPKAVILDVMLPGMDGWQVMQRLKDNPNTRHIPVHFLTCLEERKKAMNMGAVGFVSKPVDGEKLEAVFRAIDRSLENCMKRLLIVEDDEIEARSMVELLSEKGVEIMVASTGSAAIDLLSRESFDVMVLDLGLSDMSGFELLEHLRQMNDELLMPVIIHSGKALSHEEERRLRHYAESIIIKGARSPERLLNEVSLFLHLIEERLPADKQKMIRASVDRETVFEGKKVLLVDDDMRNLFSLTSILSEKQMVILEAENGIKAIDLLNANPDVDVVLMDIMMPEMDGYAAISEIRNDARFADLPIIAMTAKALKGDFEKCISSGASDYIAKPIDTDKLVSLLRVWLYSQV